MNYVWAIMIIFAFVSSIINGNMGELSGAIIQGAMDAVDLLLRLLAMLSLWGGIMEIAEQAGITKAFSRLLSPVMKLIFPKLKNNDYALSAISMNVTANILGLGNAATPLGIEAMKRLEEVNDNSPVASDEMVVFVVMNTAAMHIIPTTVATLRAQYGSINPMQIMPASILTSVCALSVAIFTAKLGNKLLKYNKTPMEKKSYLARKAS
ncbi:MAG: nucleoside recognition domain-containing protein [Clostridia bacterium]